jgi:hypothetical protein
VRYQAAPRPDTSILRLSIAGLKRIGAAAQVSRRVERSGEPFCARYSNSEMKAKKAVRIVIVDRAMKHLQRIRCEGEIRCALERQKRKFESLSRKWSEILRTNSKMRKL